MKNKCVYVGFILMLIAQIAVAQKPAYQENLAGFRKEIYGGLVFHTQGWGISATYGKFKTFKNWRLYTLDITKIKHLKEYKILGSHVDENAKSYVFGKLNTFLVVRPAIGRRKMLYQKLRDQGVQIEWVTQFGPSLGLLKPVYLNVVKQGSHDHNYLEIERYDPEVHNINNIYGRAPVMLGLTQLRFQPGIFLKNALSFEYGTEYERLKTIEVGLALDIYPKPVPIMAFTQNDFLFGTLYVNLQFGKKIL